MKDFTDWVVGAFYGALGAFMGLLIFIFVLGGDDLVFFGRSTQPWNGFLGLILCCAVGFGCGLLGYKHSHPGEVSGKSIFHDDPSTAVLFTKRLLVVGSSVIALYFLWQLAKGI